MSEKPLDFFISLEYLLDFLFEIGIFIFKFLILLLKIFLKYLSLYNVYTRSFLF